jgi:putative Holliday junction resolvase
VSRLLAFDHGLRRIGVAVADSEVGMAFERPALTPRGKQAAVASALDVVHRERATTAVVGLPRNMDGTEGAQAAAAREFGEALRAEGLTVAYVDERLTSWAAEETLASAGRRPNRQDRRRLEVDSAAARLILQDYLDARRPPEPSTPASTDQEAQ